VSNACEDFRAKAGRRDIEIVHHGGQGRATLRGDARRLRQVFGILLDNALRYSHEGGTIEVTVTTNEKEATVQVRDEGIGLTEEEASQAFQRFFRGQQATTHAQQGTGLGLPVAKAIVDAHQGSIGLTGKPGEGATATVTLPVEGSLRAVA
jgi:signal transduction histidine kinase